MFRSLRQRLIWSHILPVLLALPLMGAVLVYTLEARVLIPQLARNLVGDARLLAEISSAEFELWGDPVLFESLLSRVQLGDDIQVMFLDGRGALLFSSDPGDFNNRGRILNLPGLAGSLAGREIALSNYSFLSIDNVYVDVYEPVLGANRQVIGIVRVTYLVGSIYDVFGQVRWQILVAMAAGLLISLLLGAWLALSLSRPISEVTDAIYNLATGQRHEPVQEKGADELRAQARAVNFLVEQLHSLETSRRQLLANIVHELGRPLGSLRSAIHALGKGAGSDPALLADLTRGMDEETFRLQYLLDELANLYDRSLGGLEMNLQPLEPADWLRGVLIPWKAEADEKKLVWQEQIPAQIPPVSMDPVRMAQVVGNLVSNAVKYTPSGGSVSISAGIDEEGFFVRVQDSGPGVRPDELEKIFEPFYRGDTGRRIKQGMGLGLTIARELAAAHGGRITVISQPGGSVFTVHIPS